MSVSNAARVRRRLNHPVIDADGHWLELAPIFFEYLAEVAGPTIVDKYVASLKKRNIDIWIQSSPADRLRNRRAASPYWGFPTDALDRTAAMVPRLYRERLDNWGIDFSLVYPTMGLELFRVEEDEMRRALVRAYNVMTADMFRPYADRIAPVGLCPMYTPAEAIEESEYAVRTLGLKVLTMNCVIPRTIEADADWQADPRKRRVYIDCLGLDSPYDYDPVWAKMVELKVAVTNHMGSMGWSDRSSPTNFVAVHLGHFAQANYGIARGLFLGGVTERYPNLTFGLLEGGTGWACNLYSDLIGHWKKRNKKSMDKHLKPTNLDRAKVRLLMERYTKGDKRFDGKIDDILARNLEGTRPFNSMEELAAGGATRDDFSKVSIAGAGDIHRLFARNFYTGCEADDPMTVMAFDPKTNLRLKPILGSDIAHFDVIDATEVLPEAWEMVEHGWITEDNFREFVFSNAVELHGRMNPDFYKNTVVEAAAEQALSRWKAEESAVAKSRAEVAA